MITTGHVRIRAAKMTDLELPQQHRDAKREVAADWTVYVPRVASVATLAVVSAWVHKLGGVSSSKDVGADGSISTDRCAYDSLMVP
jgi:hypothetical protein